MLLLEPRCLAAGFQRATGMQEGQEAWGNPKVLCPSAGLEFCSGGVLVAGMAVLLFAALEVSASFNLSLETAGLRQQQQQALPGGKSGTVLLTSEETLQLTPTEDLA